MAIEETILETEEKMESAVDYLRGEMRGIRTGRASAGLVEYIKIDYYGTPTELRQLASISTPEANLIIIKPFDPGSLKDVEKAIQTSELGVTPSNDGKVIRLTIPPLSGERREQLVTQVRKMAEATRVAIRNARRDGNKDVDKLEKASEITEDDARDAKEQIQELTNTYEKKVSEIIDAKSQEIQER
jgi:ribosome recycling factor